MLFVLLGCVSAGRFARSRCSYLEEKKSLNSLGEVSMGDIYIRIGFPSLMHHSPFQLNASVANEV